MVLYQKLNPIECLQREIHFPEVTPENRMLTTNEMGYIYEILGPLTQAFLDNEAKLKNTLCEIGCGFGPLLIQVLERGVEHYVACDLSEDHLVLLAQRISKHFGPARKELFSKIEFIRAKAPTGLPVFEKKFDAILMDKVLHFMTPNEIEMQLDYMKKSLKVDGRIYILTVTPHHSHFRTKFLPVYMQRSTEGISYPGYIPDMRAQLGEDAPKHHPNQMTTFILEDLVSLLKSKGFIILKTYAIGRGSTEDPAWSLIEEKDAEVIGVIAKLN
jgi:ubiquinone/menaquinone biosynthesis C-methylase UbiE